MQDFGGDITLLELAEHYVEARVKLTVLFMYEPDKYRMKRCCLLDKPMFIPQNITVLYSSVIFWEKEC